MLRKCFIWILDRELCFHIMNEHLFLTSVSLEVFGTTLVGR